jgi:FAD synthetase
LSFNGGKDCTVLLHMMAAALHRYEERVGRKSIGMQTLYVTVQHPFPEVDQFCEDCVAQYGLSMVVVPNPMKSALQTYLSANADVQAIVIGTRRTDPFAQHLEPFASTDDDWPQVMRVHPILDWDYAEIWRYLLQLKVPYCNLYDKGYTSLGGMDNTFPNPALITPLGTYEPAYKLADGSLERDGRRKRALSKPADPSLTVESETNA